MYLQFWTFIERWQNFFFHKKINYYIYIQGPLNIQSYMNNTLFFNFLDQKLIEFNEKKFPSFNER